MPEEDQRTRILAVARTKSKKPTTAAVVVAEVVGTLEVLNGAEKQELKRCEAVIKRGWDTFVDVGRALAKIQRDRLYREHFRSFEAYCRDRWQYGKSHAHRLIGAAEVVEHLSPIGDGMPLPISEAQVRPLIGLSPEDQVKAWKSAVEKAGNKRVTARLVKSAATPFSEVKRGKRRTLPVGKKPLLVEDALKAIENALAALAENDVDAARSRLETLRAALQKQ